MKEATDGYNVNIVWIVKRLVIEFKEDCHSNKRQKALGFYFYGSFPHCNLQVRRPGGHG